MAVDTERGAWMLVSGRAAVLSSLLCVSLVAVAEGRDWGALEGTWHKLPIACGRNLEATCGGDRFTLKAGLLDGRRTCAGVQVVVRDRTADTWHVDVVG